jgi:cytochrome c biogenesis protein CcmG/thiol:disulfide interchange protein DsbE
MKFLQSLNNRLYYGIFLLLGIGWIWLSIVPANATTNGKIPAPQVGFLAPDFTLKNIDGQNISLNSLRGKVVLINIWASWCPPCRAEFPAMERTFQHFKGDGFVILGIDSTVQDTLPNLLAFIDEIKPGFPILLDENGLITKAYHVQSLPTSFFVDRNGLIREVIVGGPMAEALLFSRVEKLIKEIP